MQTKTSYRKLLKFAWKFFFGKCLFEFNLWLKKNQKKLGCVSILRHQKMLFIYFYIWKLYGNHFFPKKKKHSFFHHHVKRPNCALDRSTILCLYVPGFQRQVFIHVKILSERSKRRKEQKKNKGSVLVAESAYNAQNAQFGLVMQIILFGSNSRRNYFESFFYDFSKLYEKSMISIFIYV